MEKIQFNHEVSISRIVQGFWRLHQWNLDAKQLVDFMHQCVDLGVTSFDTAEVYGNYNSEALLGEALRIDPSLRSKIEIITKTGINKPHPDRPYRNKYFDTSYDKIIQSCNESLQKLNTSYIDVYLIHREDPLIDHAEVARAFNDLKQAGKIKAFGVSNFDPFKFEALHEHTSKQLVTNQIEISPLQFEHFNSGMLDLLQKHRIHPMIWSPLAGGAIFNSDTHEACALRKVLKPMADKYQCEVDTLVYAWLLHHPVKAAVISGSQKIERLQNCVNALQINLEREDWFEIYLASGQQVLR